MRVSPCKVITPSYFAPFHCCVSQHLFCPNWAWGLWPKGYIPLPLSFSLLLSVHNLRIWVLLFFPHALVCCLHIWALIKSLCCAGICRRSVWVGFSCKSCRRRDIHYQAHRGNDFQHWGPTWPSSNWTCLQQTRFPHHQTMANKSKPGKCLIIPILSSSEEWWVTLSTWQMRMISDWYHFIASIGDSWLAVA